MYFVALEDTTYTTYTTYTTRGQSLSDADEHGLFLLDEVLLVESDSRAAFVRGGGT